MAGAQSIGSSELTRNVTSCGTSHSARSSAVSERAGCEIAAVGTEVNACERNLLETRRHDTRDLPDDVAQSECCGSVRASWE